jgi:uncharacterized protein YggE
MGHMRMDKKIAALSGGLVTTVVLLGYSTIGSPLAVASTRAHSKSVAAAAAPVPSGGSRITTTATATVNGAPDTMTISIGVQTTKAHATAALSDNAVKASAVVTALEADGLTSADIQTQNISLAANYDQAGTLTGYTVNDTVSATLRDLAKAGSVIDDAVSAAGDAGQLNGVSFSISDESALMTEARLQAVRDARQQAQQLAQAAGVTLVSLRSLTDTTENDINPMPFAGVASRVSAAPVPTPINAGSEQLSVQVTTVWNVTG